VIHFICGKPRGGKSLLTVKLLIQELRTGCGPVVTNLPLNEDRLQEYTGGFNPSRLVVLREEECPEFYRCRGAGWWLAKPPTKQERERGARAALVTAYRSRDGHRVDVSQLTAAECEQGVRDGYLEAEQVKTLGGVWYAVDECHLFWGARNWQKTGENLMEYQSQHGKLGDTVYLITQHKDMVDRAFRLLAQDFTYVANLGKVRFSGFRLPTIIRGAVYSGDAPSPDETFTLRIDAKGIGSCYRTQDGVGVAGRIGADSGDAKKGLGWGWGVVAFFCLVMLLAWVVPSLAGKAIQHWFRSTSLSSEVASRRAAGAATNAATVGMADAKPTLQVLAASGSVSNIAFRPLRKVERSPVAPSTNSVAKKPGRLQSVVVGVRETRGRSVAGEEMVLTADGARWRDGDGNEWIYP